MAGGNGETEGGVGRAARSEAFVDTVILLCACVQMFASSEGAGVFFIIFLRWWWGVVVLLFHVV